MGFGVVGLTLERIEPIPACSYTCAQRSRTEAVGYGVVGLTFSIVIKPIPAMHVPQLPACSAFPTGALALLCAHMQGKGNRCDARPLAGGHGPPWLKDAVRGIRAAVIAKDSWNGIGARELTWGHATLGGTCARECACANGSDDFGRVHMHHSGRVGITQLTGRRSCAESRLQRMVV